MVVGLGATLRAYSFDGRAVIDGFSAAEKPTGGRGQLLVPWPNRIRDGRYRWNDNDYQLQISEPKANNAIHGLLRKVLWNKRDISATHVVLGTTVQPSTGYPFKLDVSVGYALTSSGLAVSIRARNLSAVTAPYGVGHHPYLAVGSGLADDAYLTVPADKWLRSDERGLPLATESVVGSDLDFRDGRRIGTQRIDHAFVQLASDTSNRPVVRLSWEDANGVDVWLGEGVNVVQVYTGDTLDQVARRRRGVAIEPMSCPPDAFRSGDHLVALAPDEEHLMRWGLHPWAAAAASS